MDAGKDYYFEGKATKSEHTTNSVFMLSYTSGTTDENPKGVKLTHKMIISGGYALNSRIKPIIFDHNDTIFSYLPAAHVFE